MQMKQRTKRFLKTIYLSVVVGVMTACSSGGGGGGGDDPVTPPVNSSTDTGILTVANAPMSVEGSFGVAAELTDAKIQGNALSVRWIEQGPSFAHNESISLSINDLTTGQVAITFSSYDGTAGAAWFCATSIGGAATAYFIRRPSARTRVMTRPTG